MGNLYSQVPFVVQLIYYEDAPRVMETQASGLCRTGYHSACLCVVVPRPLLHASRVINCHYDQNTP